MQRQLFLNNADIKYGELLGEGGFGQVYKAEWDHTIVAVKQITNLTKETVEEFVKEAAVHVTLSHRHIVQFYGITSTKPLGMVMEFMEQGSLSHVLRNHSRDNFGWPKRYSIALDVAKGLAYLHKKDIIHRDLKSLNVLLGVNFNAKIADFGLAKVMQEYESKNQTTGLKGTPYWMAPELFSSVKPEYNAKTDVYGYGMIMWELVTHKYPYENINHYRVPNEVVNGTREKFPDDTPIRYKQLTERCWNGEADKRPTVDDVIIDLKIISRSNQLSNANNEAINPVKNNSQLNINNNDKFFKQPRVNNNNNNIPVKVQKRKIDIPEHVLILEIPENINPKLIFAKSFRQYLRTLGHDCSETDAKMIFDSDTFSNEKIGSDMQSEQLISDLMYIQKNDSNIHLSKICNSGSLKKLADFLLKDYTSIMTQNYNGYVYPCDEMFQWVAPMVEKLMMSDLNYKRVAINIVHCQEYYEAVVLYCKVMGYSCSTNHYPTTNPSEKYRDDDSLKGIFKKSKPMTAFRELFKEKDYAGKVLLELYQVKYGDYKEACYQVSCILNVATNSFKYLEFAADNNHVKALCKIASYYENGHLVKQSTPLAIEYYQRAAKMGDKTALDKLDNIIGTPVNLYQAENKKNKAKKKCNSTSVPKKTSKEARNDFLPTTYNYRNKG